MKTIRHEARRVISRRSYRGPNTVTLESGTKFMTYEHDIPVFDGSMTCRGCDPSKTFTETFAAAKRYAIEHRQCVAVFVGRMQAVLQPRGVADTTVYCVRGLRRIVVG